MTVLERCIKILGPGWMALAGSGGTVAFVAPNGLIVTFEMLWTMGKKGRRVLNILRTEIV